LYDQKSKQVLLFKSGSRSISVPYNALRDGFHGFLWYSSDLTSAESWYDWGVQWQAKNTSSRSASSYLELARSGVGSKHEGASIPETWENTYTGMKQGVRDALKDIGVNLALTGAAKGLPGILGALERAEAAAVKFEKAGVASNKIGRTGEAILQVRRASGAQINRILGFAEKQLQKKFKHAGDFGITGNWNPGKNKEFGEALARHVKDEATLVIDGTYMGESVLHYYNPTTGLNVMKGADDMFISGWRLSSKQVEHLLKDGALGGH